jgi:ATP-binding cassette subfamily C protein
MEQAWAAVELAGLPRDIRELPMGKPTVISEEGGGMSGGQRQRLMIAHRLSTVEKADRIIVLRGGRIEEEGTHAQLLERRGVYHAMASRQVA